MQFQRRRKDRKPEGHAMNNFFGTVGSPIKMSKFDVNMEKRERRPVREDASPSKAIVAAAARHRQRRSSLGRSPSPSPSPRHQMGRSPSPSPSPRRPNKPASPPSPALAAAPEPSVNPDAVTLDLKKKIIFHKEVQRQQRQMQAHAQEAQPKPPKNDILSLHDSSDDSEDNGEENVATVRQAGRERRRSTEFMGAANVEPVEQLKLDGARKAKIPHFLSAWFNNDDKKENKDPNASPALAPAPAPGLKSGLLDEALLQSNPKLSGMTTRGYSQNINYSDITLGRMIGEGAFGKVYEGKWRGKAVAVKVLVCQDLRTDILHEFQSEIEIMSVLRHPNICRLLGACMDPPHRALVVELMQRGSLWGVLRTHRKTLDMDMRTRFIYDTAKGMAYLHHFERPILHRDLKSPNLLVDKNYNIKLSDFGLARVKAHVQTMTGNCGTVQWMAPEVLGNQKYTEKADVFSFGIVIWEIMTGECPYDGMSQIQAALGVLNRNLRPNISRDCPPFFSRLMKACWNRQPELRPSFPHIVSAFRKYQSSLSESRGSAVGSSLAVSIGAH